jgi:hypothetical protein
MAQTTHRHTACDSSPPPPMIPTIVTPAAVSPTMPSVVTAPVAVSPTPCRPSAHLLCNAMPHLLHIHDLHLCHLCTHGTHHGLHLGTHHVLHHDNHVLIHAHLDCDFKLVRIMRTRGRDGQIRATSGCVFLLGLMRSSGIIQ